MLTKTTIALAFILATATGSLAATKKHVPSSALSSYGMTIGHGDAWEQLRARNTTSDWSD